MSDPWETHRGDCLTRMKEIADDSLDSVVTDPPAGISFMGKNWDDDRGGRLQWVAWMEEVARECLRVLKPGGHALVWSIPRTSHWTGWAWENAGWQPRDMIIHLQAQGFPKSLDVSKAIDRAAGATREVVGVDEDARARACKHNFNQFNAMGGSEKGVNSAAFAANAGIITAPATPEAAQWEGWGTCLKPAMEGWWLFRKPLIGSVAQNVLAHGTGALNIDGCRVSYENTPNPATNPLYRKEAGYANENAADTGSTTWQVKDGEGFRNPNKLGRWPANLVLSHDVECRCLGTKKVRGSNRPGQAPTQGRTWSEDGGWGPRVAHTFADENGEETVEDWICTPECPVQMLNEQSGHLHASAKNEESAQATLSQQRTDRMREKRNTTFDGTKPASSMYSDSGGAARFFYTAKTSKIEKTANGKVVNNHPTVKPIALMRYFCRLITPPGGTVLDPFMGSGTTGIAALQEGFNFYGIEQDEDSHETARQRLSLALTPGLWEDPVEVVEEKPMNLNAMLGFEDE